MLEMRTSGITAKEIASPGVGDILSYSVETALETLCDGFTVVIGNAEGKNAGAILDGAEMELLADGAPLMRGVIDSVEESTAITVKGRDRMALAVDNDVAPMPAQEVNPLPHIKKLATAVGLEVRVVNPPKGLTPLDRFNIEAGDSYADALTRLAASADIYLWLDRQGILYAGSYDLAAAPLWHFYNTPEGSNCFPLIRIRSSAGLKSEITAYSDEWNSALASETDKALKKAGLNRRKIVPAKWKEDEEVTRRRLKRMIRDNRLHSRVWRVQYGGPHLREGVIPEIGKVAEITSYFSGVSRQKALITAVTLRKDKGRGPTTELELWEI